MAKKASTSKQKARQIRRSHDQSAGDCQEQGTGIKDKNVPDDLLVLLGFHQIISSLFPEPSNSSSGANGRFEFHTAAAKLFIVSALNLLCYYGHLCKKNSNRKEPAA